MKSNYPLKKLTTIKIGGPAKHFITVNNEKELIEAVRWARERGIKWYLMGGGSNLIPNGKGFKGLIIKNRISYLSVNKDEVIIGSGSTLLNFINKLNKLGLSGMEKMAGIPGTVGGAIYGSAGAYGQEIKDSLIAVRIFDGIKSKWLTKQECLFKYRDSIFKRKKGWVILAAKFKLGREDPKELSRISREIMNIREKKYPPDLLCPGSFFKNILIKEIKPITLRKRFLLKIPIDMINHGKISAGYLLESVGAKSLKCGGIKVSDYHGNLIYNSGSGTSKEVTRLSKILINKVKTKFGVTLEEEVQYL